MFLEFQGSCNKKRTAENKLDIKKRLHFNTEFFYKLFFFFRPQDVGRSRNMLKLDLSI